MANAKQILLPYSETGKTVYAVIERQADSYFLNDATGAFAAAPTDKYLSMPENSITLGLYMVTESRTAWDDGNYTVTVYKQAGGSPNLSVDTLLGSGVMVLLGDTEVGTVPIFQGNTDAMTIVQKAELLSNDYFNNRWTRDEWLKWLNDGQLQIVRLQPKANTTRTLKLFSVGSRQTTPTGCLDIQGELTDMGVDGATRGNVIRAIAKEKLDAFFPGWMAEPVGTPLVFTADKNDQDYFFTYPPASARYAEMHYSVIPAEVYDFALGTKITIRDEYAINLLDYMLYRAALKEDENGNGQRATSFWTAFVTNLGIAPNENRR